MAMAKTSKEASRHLSSPLVQAPNPVAIGAGGDFQQRGMIAITIKWKEMGKEECLRTHLALSRTLDLLECAREHTNTKTHTCNRTNSSGRIYLDLI